MGCLAGKSYPQKKITINETASEIQHANADNKNCLQSSSNLDGNGGKYNFILKPKVVNMD